MGTLFDQSERDHFPVNFDEHEELCERFRATSAMEKLKVFEIMEYSRRTDALIDNGDRWDEQIGGIGEILSIRNRTGGTLTPNFSRDLVEGLSDPMRYASSTVIPEEDIESIVRMQLTFIRQRYGES